MIAFADRQVVFLMENSRLAISTYVFNEMEPAKSSIVLNLHEGGMRAITGLIGKAKPENVTYIVGETTVRVEGTIVTTGFSNGNTTLIVNQGQITLNFKGRTYSMPAGQGVYYDSKGVPQPRPAAEVIAALTRSGNPAALILAAVLRTAPTGAIEAAISRAIEDNGGTVGTVPVPAVPVVPRPTSPS